MQVSCVGNDEHREGRCCFSGPDWVLKRSKNHVQHKIEVFCDQSIVNNVLHHILILIQKMITMVPLNAWLTTTLPTFEWPKMLNSICLG